MQIVSQRSCQAGSDILQRNGMSKRVTRANTQHTRVREWSPACMPVGSDQRSLHSEWSSKRAEDDTIISKKCRICSRTCKLCYRRAAHDASFVNGHCATQRLFQCTPRQALFSRVTYRAIDPGWAQPAQWSCCSSRALAARRARCLQPRSSSMW